MELNINELDYDLDNAFDEYPMNQNQNQNQMPIKVKRETEQKDQKIQPFPKPYAKMVRPAVPEKKSNLSYDDILNNMGMVVVNGKLQFVNTLGQEKQAQEKQTQKQEKQAQEKPGQVKPTQENSYIYNKYFSSSANEEPDIRVPKDINEYKKMLMLDIIQRIRIKRMKSTKLVLPNANMHFSETQSPANLNRLFDFSKR